MQLQIAHDIKKGTNYRPSIKEGTGHREKNEY
jgi:hypothetical protein